MERLLNPTKHPGVRVLLAAAATAMVFLAAPGAARAQEVDVSGTLLAAARSDETVEHGNIRRSAATFDYMGGTAPFRFGAPAFQTASQGSRRSVGRKVLGGAIGGVGGFFGGGFLGAAIEGDRCDCDDPGLLGFLIGAPVGAAVGAILGVKFF